MGERRRKNKSGNPIVFLVISFLGLLILLLTVIGFIALYGAWFYYEWRARKLPPSIADIAASHTIKEKVQLRLLKDEVAKLDKHFDKLKYQAQGLSRRKDGAFDERSTRGRMLNIEMPKVEAELEYASDQLQELDDAPSNRVQEWTSVQSSLYGLRTAGLIFPLICGVAIYTKPEGIAKVSFIIEQNVGSPLFGIELLYGALTASLLVSGCIFFIVKILVDSNFRGRHVAITKSTPQ